jgi:hypothetical protein
MFAPLLPECIVPFPSRSGDLLGLFVLGPRLSDEPYSSEDKMLLRSVASQAGVTLENLNLAENIAERLQSERAVSQEMEIARQVQRKLFPQRLSNLKTLEYAGGCNQARRRWRLLRLRGIGCGTGRLRSCRRGGQGNVSRSADGQFASEYPQPILSGIRKPSPNIRVRQPPLL